jgi:transposase
LSSLWDHAKKKTTRYSERNEADREAFQQEIDQLDDEKAVWVDECGMEQNLYREYARSPRGQPVYADIQDKRFEPRISVIAAYCQEKLQASLRFEGYTDTPLVETWVEYCLLPTLKPGQVVILDNAAFHKSSRIRELIESAHCRLLFLPPYSPDLNKIEHQWATLKQGIRANLQPDLSFLEKLDLQLVKMSEC